MHTPTVLSLPTTKIIQATLQASHTPFFLKPRFAKACSDEFSDYYTKISPDGKWLAEFCYPETQLQVSNQDGDRVFFAGFNDYFNDPYYPNLSGAIRPVHWSKDSHYVYFTVTPEQWNDGAYAALGSYAPTLYRMEIQSGTTSIILKGAFYHSFSPTDRRLIEIQEFKSPVKIIVHDLKTGEVQTYIPANNSRYTQAARVVWSPDGLKFVFVAAFGEYAEEFSATALLMIDLTNSSQTVIVEQFEGFLEPVSWDANDIIIFDAWTFGNQKTIYSYNSQNREINIMATPTP